MEQLEANKWWMWMKCSGRNNILGHYHHLPPHLAPAPSLTKFSGIGGSSRSSGGGGTWEKEFSSCITTSSWPPRFYSCSFCKREFRSAQALGGHMNVHRRDRALLNQIPAAVSCTTNECHDTQAHNNSSINDHFESLVAPLLCPPCPNGHRYQPKCLELKQASKVSLSSSSSSSSSSSQNRRNYKDNDEQFIGVGRKNEGCKLLRARTKPSVVTSDAALDNMSRKMGMNRPPKASNAAGGKEEILSCGSKRQKNSSIRSSAAAGSLLPPLMPSSCPKQQRYNCSSTSQLQFGLKSSASTSMVELDLELRLGDPSSL